MKSFKPLAMGLLTVALATTAAYADVTVRLTGSTAFRNATVAGIENILGGAGNFKGAYQAATLTTNGEQSATNSIFQGTVSGVPGTVTIICAWAGSVGGVKTLTQNLALTTWMTTSNLPGTNTVVNVSSPTFDATPNVTADISMSDSRQAATPFTSPSLTADKVGVVSFVWCKNNGASTSLTNITALQIRALLAGGLPLAQITGSSADTTMVFAVGRDQDSGTRVAALSDSGYGSLTNPLQFRINANGTAVLNVETYPANTVLGTTFADGTSGYSSGGNVAAALNLTGSSTASVYDTTGGDPVGSPNALIATGAYFVGYVGTGDATKLTNHVQDSATGIFSTTSGADLQVLTYNGVQYSFANVREGKYTFWTYEWLMHRSSLSGDSLSVSNKLRDNIISTAAAQVNQIALSSMHATRTVEGGVVLHN